MPKTLTRRRFTSLFMQSLVAPILIPKFPFCNMNQQVKRPHRIGTTFSPLQCSYMNIDYIEAGKEYWVAEAQAEPWEFQKLVAMDKSEYPSTSPQQATDLVFQLSKVGYETVMLWGCEYWYWHKKNGNDKWWAAIQGIVEA